MAKRIIGNLQQIDPHDVINLFALSTSNQRITDTGDGDAGVFVKIQNGALNNNPVAGIDETNILGFKNVPYMGYNKLYTNAMTVAPASSGESCIGLTLKETCVSDENDERYSRMRDKRNADGVVESGHSVPVLTRGIIHLAPSAYDGTLAPGNKVMLSVNDGKITGYDAGAADNTTFGVVLATGDRVSLSNTDRYAGTGELTKPSVLLLLNCQ